METDVMLACYFEDNYGFAVNSRPIISTFGGASKTIYTANVVPLQFAI